MKNYSLYIHIPFCSKKCDYCDFVSFSLDTTAQKNYLEALFKEIDLLKDKFKDTTFSTIFIGGGTPSVVFGGFFSKLCQKLFSNLAATHGANQQGYHAPTFPQGWGTD